jgi:pimeloyl-ACP methyl ester carboxylesterase
MAKKIPSSVHVVIPDAGHAANIDNTEVFNREVLGFLSQLDL